MMFLARFCIGLLAASLLACVNGHFNLRDPVPWNPIDCNRKYCPGPCPPIWLSGPAKAANSPENPSRSWARGDDVEIEWHRNNHEGGFYRRSLVPVKYMKNHDWHRKGAFEWGCWAQGMWECGFDATCGTDKRGRAYRNRMTVPRVFPDGDYVFAQSWYGGLNWKRTAGFFPVYSTCAFVRIEGGDFAGKWDRKFVAGTSHRRAIWDTNRVPPGKCVSTSRWIGDCRGRGCLWRKPFTGLPGEFMNGNKPKPLYLKDFAGKVPLFATRADLSFGTMKEELQAIKVHAGEHRTDNWFALQQAYQAQYALRSRNIPSVFRAFGNAKRIPTIVRNLLERAGIE